MSLALYRKYRPACLSEVVGQDHVVEPLKQALRYDRVHHAYLFSGPRGCGKTSSARILARSLNCESGPTPDPCGKCDSCENLVPNGPGSIDVIELDAATHGLVDDARELREKAVYAPAVSRYKIYIIDEAHQLGPGAANALLKLVEEPPPHVRFIFATTEPEKIITTIRSRTHHYAFRLVPQPILQAHLADICGRERVTADPEALGLVIRAAEGSVRDALSILGQLLAGAGETGLTYADAARQLGLADTVAIDRLIAALSTSNGAEMFQLITEVIDQGLDPRRFATELLERLRDLIVLKAVPEAAVRGLVPGPAEQLDRLRQQSESFDHARLSHLATILNRGISDLKGATAPRLQLELLAARLLEPAATDWLARIETLESRLSELAGKLSQSTRESAGATAGSDAGASIPRLSQLAPTPIPNRPAATERKPIPSRPPLVAAAPSRTAAAQPASGSASRTAAAPSRTAAGSAATSAATPSIEQVRAQWPAFLENVRSQSRVAWMLVVNAAPLQVDTDTVTASHPDAGTIARYRGSSHSELIASSISSILGARFRLELIHDPGRTGSGGGTASAATSGTARSATATNPIAATTDPTVDIEGSTDVDELTGLALVKRELGATEIAEYDTTAGGRPDQLSR